jgi:hypothetical protein
MGVRLGVYVIDGSEVGVSVIVAVDVTVLDGVNVFVGVSVGVNSGVKEAGTVGEALTAAVAVASPVGVGTKAAEAASRVGAMTCGTSSENAVPSSKMAMAMRVLMLQAMSEVKPYSGRSLRLILTTLDR